MKNLAIHYFDMFSLYGRFFVLRIFLNGLQSQMSNAITDFYQLRKEQEELKEDNTSNRFLKAVEFRLMTSHSPRVRLSVFEGKKHKIESVIGKKYI